MTTFYKKNFNFFLIIYLLGAFTYTGISSYRNIKNLKEKKAEKNEILIKDFRNKMEFLQSSLVDFKSIEGFSEYAIAKTENYYLITKIFSDLKKKNNFYGKMGYEISILNSKENRVITPHGTRTSEDYLTSLGFQSNNINDKNISFSENRDNFNIILKDRGYLKNDSISWILSLNKKMFFAEFNLPDGENWYLEADNNFFPLNHNRSLSKSILLFLNNHLKENRYENSAISNFLNEIFIYPDNGLKISLIAITSPSLYFITIFHAVFKVLIFSFLLFLIKIIIEKIGESYKKNFNEIEKIAETFGYSASEESCNENKDIDEKIQFIKNHICELKKDKTQRHLRDFILGIDKEEKIDMETSFLKNSFSSGIRLVFLDIYDSDDTEYERGNFILEKALIKLKSLEKELISFDLVNIDYKSLVLFVQDFPESKIEKLFEEIAEEIERHYNIKLIIGISKIGNAFRDLPKMYRDAKKLLDYKFILKDSSVISENKILEKGKINNYYYSLNLEAKLVSKALNGNSLGVKKLINELFEDKFDNSQVDTDKLLEFKDQLQNTLNRMISMLENFHKEKQIEKIDLKKMNEIDTMQNLQDIFTLLLLDICKLTKNNEQSDSDIVKIKIQSYIENNFMKDISLENLADYLGHSFKYTSILFKKIMDDNFKNYLNLYRIEKSKEFMDNGKNYKIKEIAEMVGCNSSNTFIRMFRKYVGVSPGRYAGLED